MAGLEQLRGIYREYDRMLTDFLRKQGIRAEGTTPEGLNENGQPDGYHGQEGRSRGMARLRQNEQAVGTFRFAGGWFAIPAQGYALRYLIPSEDGTIMEILDSLTGPRYGKVLAAATDGSDVWVLLDDGRVTGTGISGMGTLFSKEERVHELAVRYFTEEQIEAEKNRLLEPGGIIRISGNGTHCDYDTEEKVFFHVYADGNYYHGYEVSYPVDTREKAISRFLTFGDLIRTETECMEGKIPVTEIVSRLEDSGNTAYKPSYDYGYGIDFM